MGVFERFYHSPIQHPGLLWAAAIVALLVVVRRRNIEPGLRRYLFALVALSLSDAWLSSQHIYGIGSLSGAAARAIPLFFVLAGDFRYLLLAVGAQEQGGMNPSASRIAAALGLTLIVPLTTQLGLALLPEALDTSRVMFLLYEVLFVALTLCLMRFHPNLRSHSWLRSVSRFVVLYYSMWALADAIILSTGSDLGFGLRVLPNLLYYGGLIVVIACYAPERR